MRGVVGFFYFKVVDKDITFCFVVAVFTETEVEVQFVRGILVCVNVEGIFVPAFVFAVFLCDFDNGVVGQIFALAKGKVRFAAAVDVFCVQRNGYFVISAALEVKGIRGVKAHSRVGDVIDCENAAVSFDRSRVNGVFVHKGDFAVFCIDFVHKTVVAVGVGCRNSVVKIRIIRRGFVIEAAVGNGKSNRFYVFGGQDGIVFDGVQTDIVKESVTACFVFVAQVVVAQHELQFKRCAAVVFSVDNEGISRPFADGDRVETCIAFGCGNRRARRITFCDFDRRAFFLAAVKVCRSYVDLQKVFRVCRRAELRRSVHIVTGFRVVYHKNVVVLIIIFRVFFVRQAVCVELRESAPCAEVRVIRKVDNAAFYGFELGKGAAFGIRRRRTGETRRGVRISFVRRRVRPEIAVGE